MSDRLDEKRTSSLAPRDLARLLRELADRVEGGTLEVGADGALPGGTIKVKLGGKSKDGSASLSLKCQWKYGQESGAAAASSKSDEASPQGPERIPSYKSIKKRMGATFKKIKARLAEGALPDAGLVERFDADAALMLRYPKKGEEKDVVAFRELSAAFAAAVKGGDLEGARRGAAAMAAAEKSCHKRCK